MRLAIAVFAIGFSLAVFCVAAFRGDFVKYNVMDSLERGWWVWMPGVPTVGDVVFFREIPNAERWFADNEKLRKLFAGGFGIMKPVAASAGRRVCRTGNEVSIDGVFAGVAQERSRIGALPSWSGCRVLGDGEYFVKSDRVGDSLDSMVFGPLPAGSVSGRYVHVWP